MNYTNESAFPIIGETHLIHEQGMTLRDYFAAKAMQGIIAADIQWTINNDVLSRMAYEIADAMMKERLK